MLLKLFKNSNVNNNNFEAIQQGFLTSIYNIHIGKKSQIKNRPTGIFNKKITFLCLIKIYENVLTDIRIDLYIFNRWIKNEETGINK